MCSIRHPVINYQVGKDLMSLLFDGACRCRSEPQAFAGVGRQSSVSSLSHRACRAIPTRVTCISRLSDIVAVVRAGQVQRELKSECGAAAGAGPEVLDGFRNGWGSFRGDLGWPPWA